MEASEWLLLFNKYRVYLVKEDGFSTNFDGVSSMFSGTRTVGGRYRQYPRDSKAYFKRTSKDRITQLCVKLFVKVASK